MPKAHRRTRGDLGDLALPEIAQTLSLGRKTACVTLTSGGIQGRIWFDQGEPRHAVTDHARGESAFYEMVAWKSGRFVIEHGLRCADRSLTHDAMYLVMEGLRRVDERDESRRPEDRRPDDRRHIPWLWTVGTALVMLAAVGAFVMIDSPPEAAPVVRSLAPAPPPKPLEASEAPAVEKPEPEDPTLVSPDTLPAPEKKQEEEAPEEPPIVDAPAPAFAVEPIDEPTLPTGDDLVADEPSRNGEVAPAFLVLSGKSSIRQGWLTIHVDGSPVYTRNLVSEDRRVRRFFKKIVARAAERFEATLEIPPGEHEITAHVETDGDGDDEPGRYEDSLTISLEPGQTMILKLVAGKTLGRPLALKAD